MSLILEALRKSEEEHQTPETPEFVPTFRKRSAPETKPFLGQGYTIGISLILSGLLAIGILYRPSLIPSEYSQLELDDKNRSKQDHPNENNTNHSLSNSYGDKIESGSTDLKPLNMEQAASAPQITNAALSPQQERPVTANKVTQPSVPPHTKASTHTQRAEPQQTRNSSGQVAPVSSQLSLLDTPHINDISPQIKRQLPKLRYESHWYDKRPDKRTVIINSSNLREGARLNSHLSLHSITKNGCILDYKGVLFHMLMLQSWPEIDQA